MATLAELIEAIECTWGCGAEVVMHQADTRTADELIADLVEEALDEARATLERLCTTKEETHAASPV